MKQPLDVQVIQDAHVGTGKILPLDTSRRFHNFLGFPRIQMRPGQALTVCTQAYVPFKPKRLVLVVSPRSEEEKVCLIDIKCGKNSMFMSPDGVPAVCFPPLPQDKLDEENMKKMEDLLTLHVDTLQTRALISLNLESWSSEVVDVHAVIWGVTDFAKERL